MNYKTVVIARVRHAMCLGQNTTPNKAVSLDSKFYQYVYSEL